MSNARTLEQMKKDIDSTLHIVGALPDSLLILSTASPDGNSEYNKSLAQSRASSTDKMLLKMFPQFKDAHVKVEYLEEDWAGLMQILRSHPDFPQREEMMKIIAEDTDHQSKEAHLKELKEGWAHLVNNYLYALRSSSITMTVVMTADNADDEFVLVENKQKQDSIPAILYAYNPVFENSVTGVDLPVNPDVKLRNTIFAARTNLLLPALNVGLEIPLGTNWSVGLDYYYPWFVSSENKWCTEMLGLFVDTKYWITGDKYRWASDSKLKGHAIGLYGGVGYYDFQDNARGIQGEFANAGVDYTFSLPVANDKLRITFNLGIGYIYTLYRPYYPASDFEDLIKEPGVKYRTTNFFGPTKAGISLVCPITVLRNTPNTRFAAKVARKEARRNKRKGGDE